VPGISLAFFICGYWEIIPIPVGLRIFLAFKREKGEGDRMINIGVLTYISSLT